MESLGQLADAVIDGRAARGVFVDLSVAQRGVRYRALLRKWPEIWIAAHGTRMLRATGLEDYAQRLEIVRSAASDAGRDPMSILPAVEFLVVTGASRGAVDDALNSPILKALALTASDKVFARHGARHPLGEGFSGSQDVVPHAFDEQTALSHAAEVPRPVVREVFLSGTPGEVIDQAA